MNNMRIGKDGKTSEMRRTGRRWRKPMAQFGEKMRFRKIGKYGASSIASRMTQGIFVGHHGRAGPVLRITENGAVRGKSWTKQTLSDAWDATNWEGLCGTPWQMVAPGVKRREPQRTKKERDLECQRLWWTALHRLSREDSMCCLLTPRLAVKLDVVRVVQRWHRMEERSNPTTLNVENASVRSLREH